MSVRRKKILDACCGQGGAGEGYHRAGFDVVGVDLALKRQPDGTYVDDKSIPERYPFEFIKADAFDVLADPLFMAQFDAIHASWPCQAHSIASKYKGTADRHSDLITPGRRAMQATGLPWVIENVPGAPMRADYLLCGCMFPGLKGLRRERWFETSWHGFAMNLSHDHREPVVTVAGHGPPSWVRQEARPVFVSDWRAAMGIDWMTRDGLAQAIPPAYTELIGRALIGHLSEAAA